MTATQPSQPLVSVIMPARNADRTIDEATASVVGQTMANWELLIVDDASSDLTAQCVTAWSTNDARIRLLGGAGAGPGAARNRALDIARGTFIHFLDADDLLRADALATLTEAASRQQCEAVFGAYERLAPDGHPLDWVCKEPLNQIGLDELLERNRFPVHAQLIARAAIGDARFDESLAAVEDWDFWIALALRGVRWTRIDAVVADYRQSPMSRSSRFRAVHDATRVVIERGFASARAGTMSGECDFSQSRQRRALRFHALETATVAAGSDLPVAIEIAFATAGSGALSARDAAQSAYWLLPTARGRGPQEWHGHDGFAAMAAAAVGLWTALESSGAGESGFREQAMVELARLLVPREAIAQEIIERCVGVRSIRLLGHGANGRLLADGFRARGVEVAVADRVADIDPLDPAAGPLVVTPVDDSGFMRELPPEAAAVRWSQVQGRIAEQWMLRLRSVVGKDLQSKRGAA